MKILIRSVLLSLIAVLKLTAGAEQIIYARVGETVTLKPPPVTTSQHYLYWRSGGLELAWRNNHGGSDVAKVVGENQEMQKWVGKLRLNGDSLTIKEIQQEHFGTIVCQVNKGGSTEVARLTYKILKLDVIVEPPTPLLPGEALSLSCNAENPQSQKRPQIHWLDPQGQPPSYRQGQVRVKATGQHDGQWTCVVTYDGNEKRTSVSVTVIDLSPAPSRPQYTSKSSQLKIPCSFPERISWEQIKVKGIQGGNWHFVPKPGSSGHPQRLFSLSVEEAPAWRKEENRELVLPHKRPGDLTLTRNLGREDDSGDYECTLNFNNSITLNRAVRVEVLQIFSFPQAELISGQQLNLTCGLGHTLPPNLRLKWVPPKTSSLSSMLSSGHDPAHLTIPAVATGDGGRWKCELLDGETTLTWAVITLKIEPRLSVWMLVIICSVTVIVLLLLILLFIFCRRRQRKTTRLRHRLCQCKHPKPKGFYRT